MMSEEIVNESWDEITDTELEKRLEEEKVKREQDMNALKENGLTILSNGGDFKPRILQRPKEGPQKVTILKRPDATSSTSSSSNQMQQGGQKPQKTLEQREKEYAEARKRILGSESESTETTIKPVNYSTKISPSSSSNSLQNFNNFVPLQFQQPPPRLPDNILRNPRGPTTGSGFNVRR